MNVRAHRKAVWAGILLIAVVACKNGEAPIANPNGPTPPVGNPNPDPPVPPPPALTATIVIGSNNRFDPAAVTVRVGGRVWFVNQNNRPYDIVSDPPMLHSDCPALEAFGFIQPGESRQTRELTVARTCGFHDYFQETNPEVRGRIIVVEG